MNYSTFEGKVAVITGASSGIGKAIALALATQKAQVCLVGRDAQKLSETAQSAITSPKVLTYPTDLTKEDNIYALQETISHKFGRVDILIHSAGVYYRGKHEQAAVAQLDAMYEANVRGPYVLTQALLPMLKGTERQVVFINSTQSLQPSPTLGQFAATQQALKAVADVLRDEVNADGVRVTTVIVGRTATPRMERIFAMEDRDYQPERLLQPEDVASAVMHSLSMPRTAEVTNVHIRPMLKS